MTSTRNGRWRIVETDLRGDDSIDLLEPAYIEFGDHRLGSMVVGALQAGIDYRAGERDGRPTVEFSWAGDHDGSPVPGRGWAQFEPDNAIRVNLFIHQGDEVMMTGVPTAVPPPSPVSTSKPARRGARRSRR